MASSIRISGDDVIAFDGDSITAVPRRWFAQPGCLLDRIAAISPGPSGGPFRGATSTPSSVIVSGRGGFQRGSRRSTTPPQVEHGGAGTSILEHSPQFIMPYNPDVILLETAANDELRSPLGTNAISQALYESTLRAYISYCTNLKPTVRIGVISCMTLTEEYDLPGGVPTWHVVSNFFLPTIKAVAADYANVVCMDINTPALAFCVANHGPFPATALVLTDDGIHPSTPLGYTKYTDWVMPFLTFA